MLAINLKKQAELRSLLKNELAQIDDFKKMLLDNLSNEVKEFTAIRVGVSWDLAGVWSTFGYNFEKFGSILGLVRYMHNPENIFALENIKNNIGNISTFDAGVKYAYSKSKYSLSIEAFCLRIP